MLCLELAYFHCNFVRLQSRRLSFFIPVLLMWILTFLTIAEWQRQCFSAHTAISILWLLFSCFVLCLYSSQSADDWEAKIHLYCCLLLIFLPPPKVGKKKCNKPLIPNIFIWSHVLPKSKPIQYLLLLHTVLKYFIRPENY